MSTETAIIIQITGERLMAMADNEMDVYATPGASHVYWSSRPQFAYDECVMTAEAIINDVCIEYGLDENDLRTSEDMVDVRVPLLAARGV